MDIDDMNEDRCHWERYDDDEDENDALWAGKLPMDRVLEVLRHEIEAHNKTRRELEIERDILRAIREILDNILSDLGVPLDTSYPRLSWAWALSVIAESIRELLALRGEHQ